MRPLVKTTGDSSWSLFFCFHWNYSPIFLYALTFLPFLTLDQYSFFHFLSFRTLKFHIHVVWSTCYRVIFHNFWQLDVTRSRLSSSLHMVNTVRSFVIYFCTNLRGHFPEASQLFPIWSDIILYRNFGRHHVVSKYSLNPTVLELYHKHWMTECDHRSRKELVFLARIACISEDDSLTLKFIWIWNLFFRKEFWDSISRSFHRSLLRISSSRTTRRIPDIKIPGKSWSRC